MELADTDFARANQLLTAEWNFFLIGFAVVSVVGVLFGSAFYFTRPTWEELGGFAVPLTVAAKVFFVYAVYRLARFLRQPLWLTFVYCVLAPLAVFYLIPSIALLVAVKRTRGRL